MRILFCLAFFFAVACSSKPQTKADWDGSPRGLGAHRFLGCLESAINLIERRYLPLTQEVYENIVEHCESIKKPYQNREGEFHATPAHASLTKQLSALKD